MAEPKNASAWITSFAAFLTALDEPITLGAKNDCCRIAQLVGEYWRDQGLDEPEWGMEE